MISALLDKIMKVMGNNSVLMSFIKLLLTLITTCTYHRQEVALVVSEKLYEEHSRWYCNSGILLSIYEYCHDYFPSLLKVIDKTRDDKSGGGHIIIFTACLTMGGLHKSTPGNYYVYLVAVAGPPRVNHSEIITLYLPLSHPRKKGDTSSSQQPKTSRSFFSSSLAVMAWTRHGNLWNFQCQYS